MATNEKITLNVDLYDNIMTEQKGAQSETLGDCVKILIFAS